MKICMDCGEVEMFDVDARKCFEKFGRVYCRKCQKKNFDDVVT